MSELGRVLRLDARRAAPLVAVPLLTAVGIAASVPSFVASVAYWDESLVTLLNAVRLLGPVAAGLAAWTAVRERPLDYLRELTARSPATGVLFDLLLLSVAALVSFLAVTASVVVVALLRQEAGRPHPLGLAVGAGALVLHIVAGYLSGRVAPHRTTATVVLAATSLWAALRAPGVSWLSLLPPAAFPHLPLFTALRPAVLADQAVWTIGMTGALVLGYVVCATRRVMLVLPLVLVMAAIVVATLRLHGTGGGATSPAPAKPVCRAWPLTVCVHPALRGALPALMSAATPLASRLDGTPGAFTRVEQRPSWAPATVTDGVAAIHLDERLAPGFEGRAVRQIRDGLMDASACAAPRRPVSEGYRRLVDAWLAGEEPPSIPDVRAARRFTSWGEQRRRTWLRLHFAYYRACALGPQDFDGWDVPPRLFPKYATPAATPPARPRIDLGAR
ncbi:hypothetical protein [Actinomadura sp. NEAU-AAG7]|uniref:hypothetical protein n=1 Tax=Actinomadura sp. NEAU-AAG7 TaxID=2839640 RepID=UPI001BE3DB3C|nr:hypothetical protein [Actinomadura sp. NEAU-AAG7]MBT2209203.1 hypothetical protein [Actinomadura sp. NEAU-AAG7]